MSDKINVNSQILDNIENVFRADDLRDVCGYEIIKELDIDMPYKDPATAPWYVRAYLPMEADLNYKIQTMRILREGPGNSGRTPPEIIFMRMWNVSSGEEITRGADPFVDIRTIAKPGQFFNVNGPAPDPTTKQKFYQAAAVPFPRIFKYNSILGVELRYYHITDVTKHLRIVFTGATVKRSSFLTGVIDGSY
jgi:hypothetical protein